MWSGMRFAVAWESIKKSPPQLRRKKIARFTQHVVKAKAAEIMCMYIQAQWEAGLSKVEQVVIVEARVWVVFAETQQKIQSS